MADKHADHEEDTAPAAQPFDELTSKRFGREVQHAAQFRDEVLSRDPNSVVDPVEVAAVLDLGIEDLAEEMDHGRLGFAEVDGERIIRVRDLRKAYAEQTARLQEAAKEFIRLNGQFGWEE